MSASEEMKLHLLELLGVPLDVPVHKVRIEYDYKSPIKVDVTYETFNGEQFLRDSRQFNVTAEEVKACSTK